MGSAGAVLSGHAKNIENPVVSVDDGDLVVAVRRARPTFAGLDVARHGLPSLDARAERGGEGGLITAYNEVAAGREGDAVELHQTGRGLVGGILILPLHQTQPIEAGTERGVQLDVSRKVRRIRQLGDEHRWQRRQEWRRSERRQRWRWGRW